MVLGVLGLELQVLVAMLVLGTEPGPLFQQLVLTPSFQPGLTLPFLKGYKAIVIMFYWHKVR